MMIWPEANLKPQLEKEAKELKEKLDTMLRDYICKVSSIGGGGSSRRRRGGGGGVVVIIVVVVTVIVVMESG